MATKKILNKNTKKTTVTVSKPTEKKVENRSFFERLQGDLEKNNSILNLILGTLIVIVLGVLLFNYFNKPTSNLGPTEQAESTKAPETADVTKESLPGKYTVKEGDTLFEIAQKYYEDGYKFPKIAESNKLSDGNVITVGQVLDIPRLETSAIAEASSTPSPTEPAEIAKLNPTPTPTIQTQTNTNPQNLGTGGATNQTIWGETITGNTYTVQAGDWLSKIAGRAYGDIFQYTKIAKANNIQNPDTIEVGTVLQIPR